MNISPSGMNFIASFEGLRTTAYRDGAGVLTIGYGHTAGVTEGMVISEDEALNMLRQDAAKAEACVNGRTGSLTQNQFDALCSFTFNLGWMALKSLLVHGINNAPAQMLRWTHIAGRSSPGLVRRRTAEASLFVTPDAPKVSEEKWTY